MKPQNPYAKLFATKAAFKPQTHQKKKGKASYRRKPKHKAREVTNGPSQYTF
jgi:stalled ribosome alternative rescue factor ArfA